MNAGRVGDSVRRVGRRIDAVLPPSWRTAVLDLGAVLAAVALLAVAFARFVPVGWAWAYDPLLVAVVAAYTAATDRWLDPD